jgi:hypothetical protein
LHLSKFIFIFAAPKNEGELKSGCFLVQWGFFFKNRQIQGEQTEKTGATFGL